MIYKLRCAMARFMYGRNGLDQLGQVSVWVILILDVVAMLFRRKAPMAYSVLSTVAMAGWFWVLFRMFSKNLPKRRAENQKFMSWFWKAKNDAAGAKARRADKDHKYFTCKCGAICRVPVGKGKVVITCPKCGNQIQGKT